MFGVRVLLYRRHAVEGKEISRNCVDTSGVVGGFVAECTTSFAQDIGTVESSLPMFAGLYNFGLLSNFHEYSPPPPLSSSLL